MSYVKNWTFTVNQDPLDISTSANYGKSFGIAYVAALIVGGWECIQSSDGSSLSSTNLITSVGSIVGAANGTAHSWIILKSPQGFIKGPTSNDGLGEQSKAYLVFSWINTNTSILQLDIHRVLPTGGSLLVTPSSIFGIAKSAQITSAAAVDLTVNRPRFHFGVCTTGHFWATISLEGLNCFSYWGACYPFTDHQPVYPINKVYPYDIYFYHFSVGESLNGSPNITSTTGFAYNGSVLGGSILPLNIDFTSSIPASGDFNTLVYCTPVIVKHVGSSSLGNEGLIGRLADFYSFSNLLTYGILNGYTAIGSPQTHVVVGLIIVPCNTRLIC